MRNHTEYAEICQNTNLMLTEITAEMLCPADPHSRKDGHPERAASQEAALKPQEGAGSCTALQQAVEQANLEQKTVQRTNSLTPTQ